MAYLDKDAYIAKRELAARRMAENAEIETLTPEQHEALEYLCTVRHNIHCNQDDLFKSQCGNFTDFR